MIRGMLIFLPLRRARIKFFGISSIIQIIPRDITMSKGNLNVIIFDQDEAPSREQREPRSVNPAKSPSSQPQYDIIEQEIQYLSEKVKSLQQQTEGLVLFRNDSNITQKNSVTNIEAPPNRDLLLAIEKKIQIIIKETRKLVDRMGESFEKKLQGKLSKKYDEIGVGKIKENYAASLKKIEEHYKREIQRANKDFKQAQNRMAARAGDVEQRLLSRMNEFDLKEKEYVAWIHHLEIQLKQLGSKKMIELTQEKVGRKDVSQGSILSNNLENNYSSINQNHNPNQRAVSPLPNDNNTSKIQRKHRIFDNTNKGSSISPNNKVHANPQPVPPPQALMQSSKLVNPAIRTKPFSETEPPEQPVTISLATRNQEPIKNLFASNSNHQQESSPWRMIERDSGKRTGDASMRNKVIENVREEEFYKDVPKPNSGWEKFQDFKEVEDDSSDSDEDVLFYREGDQQEEFLDHFRSTKLRTEENHDLRRTGQESKKDRFSDAEQKVFSPFDLN